MDFRQLFKLRLVVAAMGETQRLGWWNSGVLTSTGEFLFQQGFPRSSPFAQTRAGFRVAQLACDERYMPTYWKEKHWDQFYRWSITEYSITCMSLVMSASRSPLRSVLW